MSARWFGLGIGAGTVDVVYWALRRSVYIVMVILPTLYYFELVCAVFLTVGWVDTIVCSWDTLVSF